jgi:hypothetical protein
MIRGYFKSLSRPVSERDQISTESRSFRREKSGWNVCLVLQSTIGDKEPVGLFFSFVRVA